MEFYWWKDKFKRRGFTVSIPNGMEFYLLLLSVLVLLVQRFNSQRDGILPAPVSCVGFVLDGFNSQRDGILPQSNQPIGTASGFQFPTGWNFTLRRISKSAFSPVSIPNGMEFYAMSDLSVEALIAVSIPNGMEFYFSRKFL